MLTVLEATILTRKASGEDVFIPKSSLIPSHPNWLLNTTITTEIKLSKSINNAQGQTLEVVELNFAEPAYLTDSSTSDALQLEIRKIYSSMYPMAKPKALYITKPHKTEILEHWCASLLQLRFSPVDKFWTFSRRQIHLLWWLLRYCQNNFIPGKNWEH